jgi:seryl-tRNA synthetase
MDDFNLNGMSVSAAREFIFAHITTAKLNEKKSAELEAEHDKWQKRVGLARSSGDEPLASEAEKAAAEISAKIETLKSENAELKTNVERMIRQLPGLAARERSIDPDLLVQELLIAAGFNPGDEDKLVMERKFSELEKI